MNKAYKSGGDLAACYRVYVLRRKNIKEARFEAIKVMFLICLFLKGAQKWICVVETINGLPAYQLKQKSCSL